LNANIQTIPAIFAHLEPGDGYRYSCVMAGGTIAIHCPGNGTSYTDDGYGVRALPPPLSWCQMRVGEVQPKTPRAARLRIAAVLHTCLMLQYETVVGGEE
jgi:hypothetical protein